MKKNIIFALTLVLCFLLSICLKAVIYQNSTQGRYAPFTNVDAVHYYFTEIVAKGDVVPEFERRIQYPEGMRVYRELSIFMEYVVGYSFRFFSSFLKIRLDDFIRIFIWVFSSLSLFAVYLTSWALTKDKLASVLASFIYGFSIASISRSTGLGYNRENFTLTVIFFLIAFFFLALENYGRKKTAFLILGGVSLFIGLASWQFTQFFYLAFIIFILLSLISKRRQILNNFVLIPIFSILAGLLVPYLKANNFLISIPMLLSYAILISYIIGIKFKNLKGITIFFVALGIFILLKALTFRFSEDFINYQHVYDLLFYKIKFLGIKPPDPAKLSQDTRLLWDVAHTSDSFIEVLRNFGIAIALGFAPFYKNFNKILKGDVEDKKILFTYLTVIFAFFYILVNRLSVFLIFFTAIWAGQFFIIFKKRPAQKIARTLVILTIAFQFLLCLNARAIALDTDAIVGLLSWVKLNTKEDDCILASPRSSPEILAYTGRPIVLHAKLETKFIRDKSYSWANALFKEEEADLYELCKSWNASYFVFSKGTYLEKGFSSWRYITNNLSFNPKAVGCKLEALPAEYSESEFNSDGSVYKVSMGSGFNKPKLKHFDLVFRNRYFNVYKIK